MIPAMTKRPQSSKELELLLEQARRSVADLQAMNAASAEVFQSVRKLINDLAAMNEQPTLPDDPFHAYLFAHGDATETACTRCGSKPSLS
jgi:hypothetical protein